MVNSCAFHHKRLKHLETKAYHYELIFSEVHRIRKLHLKHGTLKLFKELSSFFEKQEIKMGKIDSLSF